MMTKDAKGFICNCRFDQTLRPVEICEYHDRALKFAAKKATENERGRVVRLIEERGSSERTFERLGESVLLHKLAQEIRDTKNVNIQVAVLDPNGHNLLKGQNESRPLLG